MTDGSGPMEYTGPYAWVITLAVSVATGVASALGVNRRVTKLEERVSALEEAKKAGGLSVESVRDEVLSKLRELGEELRRDIADRAPDSLNLPGLHGLLDSKIQAAVSAAVAVANEKHLDRLMELRDRISEITGTVKGIVGGGRR